mgnify:CR=1 FL=1
MDLNPSNQIAFITEDIRKKNEGLVLAPLSNMTKPKKSFLDVAIDTQTNLVDLQDYSDVKFTDAYERLSDGSYVAKYPSVSVYGGDQEQYFAERQDTGDKWSNGLLKAGGTALTTLVGGTAGFVNGLVEFAKTGNFQSTYDNDFSKWLDDLNTKWRYELPNYYTQEEREAGFFDSFGSANFWANDVVGGAAFTVGAIGSEALWAWATGGSSLATTTARLAPKVGRIGRWADDTIKAVNKTKEVMKAPIVNTATKKFANIDLPTGLATNLGKVGEFGHTLRFTMTSAGTEAGMEARHYMREMEDDFYQSYMEKNNGQMPSVEEELEFRESLNKSANALYAFNMGVVGASNIAIMGKLFKIKSPISMPDKWANAKLFGVGTQRVDGKLVALTATKPQKMAKNIWGVAKSPIIEGLWEEGLQSVGSNTAKNWVEAGYNPEYTKETFGLGEAFINGFAETYGTKEGWKEVGIGMLIGLFTGTGVNLATGRGIAGEFKNAETEVTNRVNFDKYYSPKKVAEEIAYANRVQEASKNQEVAESKGDFTSAELSRKSAAIAQLNFGYNLDYFDETVRDTTIAIENIDNESIMKEYGVTEQEAEALKEKMVAEYQNTAKTFKKYRQFADYYVSTDMSKEGVSKEEAPLIKQAIAYELTLGSEAYKFSSEILETLKSKIAGGYSDVEITSAMDVDNILLTAKDEVKAEFEQKKKEIIEVSNKKKQLEQEKDNLLKVILDENQEQKVSRLAKLNNVEVQLQELNLKSQELEREANATLASANLTNPFKEEKSQQYLTSEQIEKLDENLNKVVELADAFRGADPQKALEIEKLRLEYARSLGAFKRYADLARQLSDPKLGLRGRRNIITELRTDKTPSEITVETLEGLLPTVELLRKKKERNAIIDLDYIPPTETEEEATMEIVGQVTEVAQPKQTPLEAIKAIIKNNPYLLSYKGEGIPQRPTEQEIGEYYDLATRALSNENFDPQTIGFSGQLQLALTSDVLSAEELERLQELNQKMSDWQLYGGATNSEGLSINDIIEQQMLLEEDIAQEEVVDVMDEEFTEMINPEPTIVDGESIRLDTIVQVYSRVFVKAKKDAYEISNIGIQKFLDGLDIADEVTVIVNGKVNQVNRSEVGKYNTPSHSVTVTFRDGSNATISIEPGGVLKIEEFNKVIENSNYTIDRYTAGKQSGYSVLYQDGVQVESDFKVIDGKLSFTSEELYNMSEDERLTFQVNLNDPYNRKLLNSKKTDEEIAQQLNIYVVDSRGNIVGNLKANRDVTGTPEFLQVRAMALQMIKEDTAEAVINLPFEVPISHLFLGVPNLEIEGNTYKTFEIDAKNVVTFGYTQGGDIVLNEKPTQKVRKDLVSKIMKRDGVPIIVFRQGEHLIAYPLTLKKTQKSLGGKVQEILDTFESPSKAVVEINKLLKSQGLSPKSYNIYYTDRDNQTLFNENGTLSDGIQRAISDLDNAMDFVSPQEWKSVEDVVNSANINVDLNNRPLNSPKPVLDFTEMIELKGDWYSEFKRTGEITEEKATEIANKALFGQLTAQEYDASDHPLVIEKMEEIEKMAQQKAGKSKKNKQKPC